MIQEVKLTLVVCDEPVMRVGVPGHLSWAELQALVHTHTPLIWEMHGEWRMLPPAILTGLNDIRRAHADLTQLGRGAEIALKGLCFTRAQTVAPPWSGDQGLDDRRDVGGQDPADEPSDSDPT
jgi:hypothetical protein